MDDTRQHLFARTGLPKEENGRVRICYLYNLLKNALHRRTPCDDVFHTIQFVDERFESLNLSSHPLRRESLFNLCLQFLVIEWFSEIPEGPTLHGFHSIGNTAVGCQYDDRKAWMNPQQLLRHIQSVLATQAEIGNDEIEPVFLGCCDGLTPSCTASDGEAHGRQPHFHKMQEPFFIVDYENMFLFHETPSTGLSVPAQPKTVQLSTEGE